MHDNAQKLDREKAESLSAYKYLSAIPFVPQVSSKRFTQHDWQLLVKFGSRFQALLNGRIVPLSERQHRFVREIAGEIVPSSESSMLWIKYLVALRDEAAIRLSPAPVNSAEDFLDDSDDLRQLKVYEHDPQVYG